MDTTGLILTVGLAVLVLLSGVFSGSETALFSLDRIRLRRFERSKSPGQRAAARLMRHPERLLAGILLGNTLVNVASSSVALGMARRALPEGVGEKGLVLAATFFCTALILVLGEILPKGVALRSPETVVRFHVWLLAPMLRVMRPISEVLAWIAGYVLRLFGLRSEADAAMFSRHELRFIFEDITKDEGLTEKEGEIASNIFDFSETRAFEIMTPRVDVRAIDISETATSLKEAVIQSNHSRIPVFRESLDQVVGVINAKDVLLEPGQPLDHFLRPVTFIPERTRLSTILNEVKAKRLSFLVLVNEFGGTAGILTKEDLVEEIVGEIFDEQEGDEEPEIKSLGVDTWRINGLLALTDLNEEIDVKLVGPAQTVAGHVAHLLGRPPRQGDTAQDQGVVFRVLSVKRHRASHLEVEIQ